MRFFLGNGKIINIAVKIVLAGEWRWTQYERGFALALKDLGQQVVPFRDSEYFTGIIGRKQRAVPILGPALLRMNRALIEFVDDEKPDILLAWRGTHLLPFTIKAINKRGVLTVSYNNDDPFMVNNKAPWHHHLLWLWFRRSVKYYRQNYFYRSINVSEAMAAGAAHADLLKPYFIPWKDKPIKLTGEEQARFGCDAVFVGHYEPDGRVNHLQALVRSGLAIKLYGDEYWTQKVLGDLYRYFAPVMPVYDDDYTRALCGARICLSFLSKLNRDTYTRRCFEIPACRRVLLAERSDDLLDMFKENIEACFFSTEKELVEKARWLIENPVIAQSIAEAGNRRVWADGHDIGSRAKEFLRALDRQDALMQGESSTADRLCKKKRCRVSYGDDTATRFN